jgi:hypothetical protein
VNRDSLTSLSICIPFISSSCLIALARNSKTILNRSGENWHPCLVPDFTPKIRKWFQLSPLSMMSVIVLSYIACIMLRYIPSISSFIRDFIIKLC